MQNGLFTPHRSKTGRFQIDHPMITFWRLPNGPAGVLGVNGAKTA
jgi:hypothetical protein